VNQREFKAFENECARALKRGLEVSVDIEILYNENDPRPAAFIVEYIINGKWYSRNIKNYGV